MDKFSKKVVFTCLKDGRTVDLSVLKLYRSRPPMNKINHSIPVISSKKLNKLLNPFEKANS